MRGKGGFVIVRHVNVVDDLKVEANDLVKSFIINK